MNHSDYIAYFKTIATAHEDIRHFARMIYVDWPYRNTKLEEFFSSQRKSEGIYPMMVLESYINKFTDYRGDNIDKHYDAGFLIMQPAERGNFADEDLKYDQCEQICEEIVGYVLYEFEQHWDGNQHPKRFIEPNTLQFEKIGAFADNVVGVRVSFQFFKNASPQLMYNPDKFTF